MRNILALSMFCTGCFNYDALSSSYGKDTAPVSSDLGGDLSRWRVPFDSLQISPPDLGSEDLSGADLTNTSDGPVAYPASCDEANAGAVEGDITLFAGGNASKPWGAHCVFTPAVATYLNFVHTGGGYNFSQYTAGGNAPGTNVVTSYTRVRIDPATFIIDTSDETFSSSTGALSVGGADPVSSMPFGVAMNCGYVTPGAANVDVTGTPFSITTTAQLGGAGPTGSNTTAPQSVSLQGGGNCGWNALGQYTSTPYKTDGGSVLHLTYQ